MLSRGRILVPSVSSANSTPPERPERNDAAPFAKCIYDHGPMMYNIVDCAFKDAKLEHASVLSFHGKPINLTFKLKLHKHMLLAIGATHEYGTTLRGRLHANSETLYAAPRKATFSILCLHPLGALSSQSSRWITSTMTRLAENGQGRL